MIVFLGTQKGEQVLKCYSFITSRAQTDIERGGQPPPFSKSQIFSPGKRRYKSDSFSDTISICVKFCEKAVFSKSCFSSLLQKGPAHTMSVFKKRKKERKNPRDKDRRWTGDAPFFTISIYCSFSSSDNNTPHQFLLNDTSYISKYSCNGGCFHSGILIGGLALPLLGAPAINPFISWLLFLLLVHLTFITNLSCNQLYDTKRTDQHKSF